MNELINEGRRALAAHANELAEIRRELTLIRKSVYDMVMLVETLMEARRNEHDARNSS